jgi:hypothetical protein
MTTELGANNVSRPSLYILGHKGKAYSFQSKEEAVRFLSQHNSTNVDVGCMQINLVAHCKEYAGSCTKEARLQMAYELLDKKQNLLFANKLLKRAAAKGKLGYYHSKTKSKYEKYVEKVNKVLVAQGLKGDFR